MSDEMTNSMVPVGIKGEYEVYQIMPCGVQDALEMEAEISTHYKHDTIGVYDSSDDVDTTFVRVGTRWYEYVNFGKDNLAPYRNQQLIEDNMVMSQCQNFNILTCYGQGVRFLDRETGEKTTDKDIRAFCLRNAIHLQWLRMATDMKYNYFSVLVINLSRDHSEIVKVSMRNACDCRFTKRNKLEYRMGKGPHIYTSDTIEKPPVGVCCKFAIVCLVPTPGYRYYPVPYYASIYRDAWYDIYRLIGIGKRYMIKNTSAPRIQVEVHRSYWDNVCKEENITDKVKRAERIKLERHKITEFCTKPENAGKAWVTSYDTLPDGKGEKRMVRVYDLVDGKKKEGGDWSDDMQEASNSLCFAMGVHPNMVGAVPGKSQMNNSGSDKRELFTLKQALEKAFHDVMEVPYHVIMHYNGWDEKFAIDVPIIQLTTLDKNKDAEEKSVNTDDNGNNNQNQ